MNAFNIGSVWNICNMQPSWSSSSRRYSQTYQLPTTKYERWRRCCQVTGYFINRQIIETKCKSNSKYLKLVVTSKKKNIGGTRKHIGCSSDDNCRSFGLHYFGFKRCLIKAKSIRHESFLSIFPKFWPIFEVFLSVYNNISAGKYRESLVDPKLARRKSKKWATLLSQPIGATHP